MTEKDAIIVIIPALNAQSSQSCKMANTVTVKPSAHKNALIIIAVIICFPPFLR